VDWPSRVRRSLIMAIAMTVLAALLDWGGFGGRFGGSLDHTRPLEEVLARTPFVLAVLFVVFLFTIARD
jgi:ABC-type proline/glycine betaine transport system permease subunit